jgi:hypothetical protein
VPMRVIERARHLASDAQRFVEGKLALAVEARAQRLAGNVRHDVIELAVYFPRVVDGQYVRVAQVGGEVDLTAESLRTQSEPHISKEDFDRDFSIVL